MKDGLYSALNKIVRQQKQEGNVIFDTETTSSKIDLSGLDREELEERCKKAMTAVVFYQNGLRSVIHGQGIYVDYEKIKNRIVIEKLLTNAKAEEAKKELMVDVLTTIVNGLPEDTGNQMYFDPDRTDENGELLLFEEKSKEELIEMLKELIEVTS